MGELDKLARAMQTSNELCQIGTADGCTMMSFWSQEEDSPCLAGSVRDPSPSTARDQNWSPVEESAARAYSLHATSAFRL